MRKTLILILAAVILLATACKPGVPNTDTPAFTLIPPETQAAPTGVAPTEANATQPPPSATDLPASSETPNSPSTQIPPTVAPTEEPIPIIRFYMQPGTPALISNFVKPESGCNWMGIAGQVFDLNGNPLAGAVIEVGGTLEGQPIQQIALTGSSPNIGPGGYVIELSSHPVQSDGTLWFQLLDQQGEAKTARILLTTSAQCEQNLILINLVEATPIANLVRLPVILKSSR